MFKEVEKENSIFYKTQFLSLVVSKVKVIYLVIINKEVYGIKRRDDAYLETF